MQADLAVRVGDQAVLDDDAAIVDDEAHEIARRYGIARWRVRRGLFIAERVVGLE